MIETDSINQPVEVDDLDAEWVLMLCEEAEQQSRIAERRRLRYALRWADLHPATPEDIARERVEPVGGDGTPYVEELTTEALGAAFGITTHAALQLVSDALDLRHRLPRIHQRVERLEIPAWRARRIAQTTHSLTRAQARAVDAAIAAKAGTCGLRTIDKAIAAATAQADPDEQAEAERLDRSDWKVQLFHGPVAGSCRWVGTSILQITGDTADLTDLYHRLNQRAIDAGKAGDPDPIEVRRARAVGTLLREHTGAGHPSHQSRVRLYLHAEYADLADPIRKDSTGIGSAERLGPITTATIKQWVGHRHVTVVPVIRTDRTDAVDQHDPPAWMRELVVLRDRHCVFPHCQTDSRGTDLDHIETYADPHEGGPPGQTHPDNLAPLCRRHHRTKTHHRWRYRRLPDGSYWWTSPHQHSYIVDTTGTHPIR